jgi:hypothetical protein
LDGGAAMNPQIQGMTLRDWFAGMALSGLISKVLMGSDISEFGDADPRILKSISHDAYTIADQMINIKLETEE